MCSCRYIAYHWIGQISWIGRSFYILATTSNANEERGVHFQYFINIDVVTFQLIQSKMKLVLWVPGLNYRPSASKYVVVFTLASSMSHEVIAESIFLTTK